MGVMVAVPEWAAPNGRAVIDGTRLAEHVARAAGTWQAKGRFTAVQWVLYGGPAPVLHIGDEPPPDRARVEQELATAATQARRAADDAAAAWASGVVEMLEWLLGVAPDPGLPLPRRHPDGRVWTAEDAYQDAGPQPWWGPRERADARRAATRAAARWAALADLTA